MSGLITPPVWPNPASCANCWQLQVLSRPSSPGAISRGGMSTQPAPATSSAAPASAPMGPGMVWQTALQPAAPRVPHNPELHAANQQFLQVLARPQQPPQARPGSQGTARPAGQAVPVAAHQSPQLDQGQPRIAPMLYPNGILSAAQAQALQQQSFSLYPAAQQPAKQGPQQQGSLQPLLQPSAGRPVPQGVCSSPGGACPASACL